MVIRRVSRWSGFAALLFALVAFTPGLAAQSRPGQPRSIQPPTDLERIAGERDWAGAQPRNFAWSGDGKQLGYIRTLPPTGRGALKPPPSAEIRGVDTATGSTKPLVSSAELVTGFGWQAPRGLQSDEDQENEAKSRVLQGISWAPGGHELLVATNSSIVWFDLDRHSSRPVVTGKEELVDPQISPDGHTVSFIRDHSLWLADAAKGAPRKWASAPGSDLLEGEPDWVYDHELGLHSAYWWSPDSSAIAWLETDDRAVDKYSLRSADGETRLLAYPKPGGAIPTVRLFVRGVAGGKPLQINLGSDANVYIPRVQWLPDGKHLAIERLNRDQKTLELLLADPLTGKSHVVLSEKDPYWVNLSDDLHFLSDGRRFLWSSERSGYRHLYLYDLSGKQLAQVTHGDWEVTSLVGVDEAADAVYFTATEASPVERQLYRAKLDGSGFTRITKERGTHDVQLSPAAGVFLDTWSTHAARPRLDLLHADGSRIGTIGENPPADALARQLGSMEFLTFKTHLDMDIHAWIIKPPDFSPEKHYPVIVYVGGGPGQQNVRDAWGGDVSLWFALMAQKGYIVFTLDPRGSAGRGHYFEEPVHLRLAASEMADVRDGVMYLHSQPWVDKARLGICGWGYGGFVALHGMTDRPVLFKAGFAGSPITDWHLYDAVFGERYLESPVRNQDGWLSSSAVENAENLTRPLLLAQATLDETIHFENSLVLEDELLDNGKYADILVFADRTNVFEDRASRLALFDRLTDFFARNL